MDVLVRIKRLVLQGQIELTLKARDEMVRDGLTLNDVAESIMNAHAITKTIRSRSRYRRFAEEKLYVIKSLTFDGTFIYTKGTIVRQQETETFYVLVSSKIATIDD